MITFECSSCKAQLQVKDEHAGKLIQCPACKEKTNAPSLQAAPVEAVEVKSTGVTSPENVKAFKKERQREDEAPSPRRRDGVEDGKAASAGLGMGAILVIALGVGGCCILSMGAVMVALLVPAVQKTREAAAQTQSINNLKQIGLAMQSFHDTYKRIPFNGIAPGAKLTPAGSAVTYYGNAVTDGASSGSWLFQISPYCDQQALFHLTGKFESDVVPPHMQTVGIPTYMCPGRMRPTFEVGKGPWSDYAINNYLNVGGMLGGPSKADKPDNPDIKRTLIGITDGTSNTIFAGHGYIATTDYTKVANVTGSSNIYVGGTQGTMRGGPNNMQPGRGPTVAIQRDTARPADFTAGGWGGPFAQGGLMAWCDGTVRLVSYSTPQDMFGAYLTPTNGEAVPLPD